MSRYTTYTQQERHQQFDEVSATGQCSPLTPPDNDPGRESWSWGALGVHGLQPGPEVLEARLEELDSTISTTRRELRRTTGLPSAHLARLLSSPTLSSGNPTLYAVKDAQSTGPR